MKNIYSWGNCYGRRRPADWKMDINICQSSVPRSSSSQMPPVTTDATLIVAEIPRGCQLASGDHSDYPRKGTLKSNKSPSMSVVTFSYYKLQAPRSFCLAAVMNPPMALAELQVPSGAARHQTPYLDIKWMRTGTRTGWWKWTGGLNVCSNTLLRQSCCEGQLWPHNTLNLEEEKMQVHQFVPLFPFLSLFFFANNKRVEASRWIIRHLGFHTKVQGDRQLHILHWVIS